MVGSRRQPWVRALAPALRGLGATALLAVLCNLVLELSQLLVVEGYPWRNKTPFFPLLFLLGSVVLWLVIGLVHAVVGRMRVTTVVALVATSLIAFADIQKVRIRREPLYPSDWEFVGQLGFLADVVGRGVVLALVMGLLLLVAAVVVGARAVRRRRLHVAVRPEAPSRGRVALRVLTGGFCLLLLGYLSGFNTPGNAVRGAYEAFGATWKPWSQQRNYLANGFVGGFLYNMDVPVMPRPKGYGRDEMARISARYAAAAERINRTRRDDGLRDVNVVMVLSESLSDPEALHGVHLDEDPLPFTRRLMSTDVSGPMLAQHSGGGTANMELEALTGMSVSLFPPQCKVPYQMLLPDYETFPSVVRWLEQDGHRSLAIHPFTTEMYRRREVYRSFGFDEFVYDETMRHQERIGHDGYISDAAAFAEVEQRLVESPEPLFVNLVTMQNHLPYPGRYDDPLHATGPDGEPLPEVGQYARGLAHSDRALEALVGRLSRSEEKTVLVLYGDHLPGIYPDSVFAANSRRAMHQTPFLVWANFGRPGKPRSTTSPAHFMDLVLERADADVPPWFALLDELRNEIPAMDGGLMFDASGRPIRARDLSARQRQLLHDYRLVQYDLSVGRRYSLDAMLGQSR